MIQKNMDGTVTISLKDFDELREFKKRITEGDLGFSYYYGDGYIIYCLNKEEAIEDFAIKIRGLEKENIKLSEEIKALKEKLAKKKWWKIKKL